MLVWQELHTFLWGVLVTVGRECRQVCLLFKSPSSDCLLEVGRSYFDDKAVTAIRFTSLSSAAKLWNKVDATIYTFTYIMGFVVTGVFVILFLLLIIFQGAVRERHNKARRARYPEGKPPLMSHPIFWPWLPGLHLEGLCRQSVSQALGFKQAQKVWP